MKSNLIFGNCAELRSEKVDPKASQESLYIGLEHIEQQSLSLTGHGYGSNVDSQKQKFYKGDILFGKLRPYFRKVVIAPFDGICSTDIWVVKPKSGIDRNFLFYWMASENFIASSTYASEGGRMPRAKWDWVSKFEIERREPEEQAAIGTILRALDKKIAANNAISKTLEDIAKAIFKSWFIDFDPVKAKMAGETPAGMDAATAKLFPDSMEESELGLVPKGWEISSAGAFCPFKYGKALPASNRIFGAVPVYGSNGVVGNHNEALTLAPSIVIGRKGTVGTVNLEFGPCWIIDTAFYTSTAEPKDIYLAYLQLKTLGLNEMNSDGAVPGLNRDNAHRDVFTIGTPELRNTFAEVAHNLFTKISYCHAENRSLTGIRDSLLPRLISGELQIPEEMLAS